jgi:hypothetical protein
VLWRNLRTRRARILDDQGLDAHRRENIRREDGIHGQPLGDGGGAGVSMHVQGRRVSWRGRKREGNKILKDWPQFLPSRSLQKETAKDRAL